MSNTPAGRRPSPPPDQEPPPHRGRRDPGSRDLAEDDTHIIGIAQVHPEPPAVDELFDEEQERADSPAGPDPLPEFDPSELAGLQGEGGASTGIRRVLPLEDEASPLVARYLFPTERYRGEWKRHLIHLAWPMVIGVVSTLAIGWLAGSLARWGAWNWTIYVVVLIWLGFMGYVAWRVADWHFDRFILTNKRVMKVAGIITRDVAMMPLLRVTDMKYVQTPLGRVLNYGTFVIESAGQDQALREVPHLPNPNELYLRVVEEMYEPTAVEARMGETEEPEEESDRKVGDI